MGFRKDAYATVWSVESKSNTLTKIRISISRKNKQTDLYEQDFSGFAEFVGTANAAAALRLKERDRIKLGDVDVTNKYDKERGIEFIHYKVFSFEPLDGSGNASQTHAPDSGEPEENEADLPF